MNIITSKNIYFKSPVPILKVFTVISYLLIFIPYIASPFVDPPSFLSNLMGVELGVEFKNILLRKTPFDLSAVMTLVYWASIIYLLFFSYSQKPRTLIFELLSLTFLFFPIFLSIAFLSISSFSFFNPSVITIGIFCVLGIALLVSLLRQLITVR